MAQVLHSLPSVRFAADLKQLQQLSAGQPASALSQTVSIGQQLSERLSDRLSLRFGSAGTVKVDSAYTQTLKKNGAVISGGAGVMGSCIAMNLMNTGVPVVIQDYAESAVTRGRGLIEKDYQKAAAKGVMSVDEATQSFSKLVGGVAFDTKSLLGNPLFVRTFRELYPGVDITDGNPSANFNKMTFEQIRQTVETLAIQGVAVETMVPSLSAMPKNAAIVIEAIPEDLKLKQLQFLLFDKYFGEETVIASNTSSLSVAQMAASHGRPDRFVGIHFFKPANRNRFLEVIPGPKTSPETVSKAFAMVRALGKTPIKCNDSPGFVVNRLGIPLVNEGVRMLDEGVANQTTIDQVALETLWPTYHKKAPGLENKVLLPFRGINQDNYLWVIGATTQVLDSGLKGLYGDSYKPSKTVLEKFEQYDAAQSKMYRGEISKADLDGFVDTLRFKEVGHEDLQADKKEAVRDRFMGMVFGIAGQLIDEGVTTPEDVDRGVKMGLAWEVGPFELMNEVGVEKSLALVEKYAAANPGFKVPESLKVQAKTGKPFELSTVDTRREGSTQFITINRPAKFNALDENTLNGLQKAFQAAEADNGVKTIVFESVGNKAFVAGADIFGLMDKQKEVNAKWRAKPLPGFLKGGLASADMFFSHLRPFVSHGRWIIDEIAQSKKKTVAKVDGFALGGGLELALACKNIVATPGSTFGLPEVGYGIFPAWNGTEWLSKRVGKALAKFLVLEGGLIQGGKGAAVLTAQEGKKIGLVDHVVEAIDLDHTVDQLAATGQLSNVSTLEQRKPKTEAQLKGTRFADKLHRYATASLDELKANELKPLMDQKAGGSSPFSGAIDLAYKRVVEGDYFFPLRQQVWMALNMSKVQAFQAKQAKAKKA